MQWGPPKKISDFVTAHIRLTPVAEDFNWSKFESLRTYRAKKKYKVLNSLHQIVQQPTALNLIYFAKLTYIYINGPKADYERTQTKHITCEWDLVNYIRTYLINTRKLVNSLR